MFSKRAACCSCKLDVILDQSQNPCEEEETKVLTETVSAASEVFVGVDPVIMENKHDTTRYRLRNIAPKNYANLQRAGVKQMLVCKQEGSPSLDQEEQELPHIKVEQEELWTSQEGEQLQGLKETDIKITNNVFIKSEQYKEEPSPQSISSDQSETKTEDSDDEWKEPGLNTGVKQILVCKQERSPSLDQEEQELPHIKVEQEEQEIPHIKVEQEELWSPSLDQEELWSPSLDQEEQELPYMKVAHEEVVWTSQEEVWTSQEGEQLQGLNETHIKVISIVFIKSEQYKEEPQSVSSDQSETKTEDNDDERKEPGLNTGSQVTVGVDRTLDSSTVAQLITTSGSKPNSASFPSCQYCGKLFLHVSSLKVHERVHTGEKPYHCQLCGKSFSVASGVKLHQYVHTGVKPYPCQQCGKSFTAVSSFRLHQRVHTGERPYHCQQCGKSFMYLKGFKRHECVHTGEKPYHCQLCGKSFSVESGVKLHQYVHTGVKPYPCQQCGKSFTTVSGFKRHQCIHTAEKP